MNFLYYINKPRRIITQIFIRLGGIIADKPYLQILYKLKTGKNLDLNNPQTYNEKLQWLKLYDRNPLYTKMVDKYAVKEYVSNIIGVEHVIPTLGVWNDFDEIDFDLLPENFVLKTTHDSGGIFICKDKKKINKDKVKKNINKHLKRNFYSSTREWPYKGVSPRIIAEPYMVDESGYELKDYKVFVFNGDPKIIQVDYGRFSEHKRNIYNVNWEFLDFEIQYPNDLSCRIKKPAQLDEMLSISSLLSENIAHVRVDFYVINNKLYFGELTFYHGSGYESFRPEKWNYILGQWLTLPSVGKK